MSFKTLSPKGRWKTWRNMAKMEQWIALRFCAPPKAVQLLQETTHETHRRPDRF